MSYECVTYNYLNRTKPESWMHIVQSNMSCHRTIYWKWETKQILSLSTSRVLLSLTRAYFFFSFSYSLLPFSSRHCMSSLIHILLFVSTYAYVTVVLCLVINRHNEKENESNLQKYKIGISWSWNKDQLHLFHQRMHIYQYLLI